MCEISLFVTATNQEGILLATYAILGDPGAVSRVGRKGGTKVFKYGRKSPRVPTLTGPFPKIQADAGFLLGTKNALFYCAQSANISPEFFSCVRTRRLLSRSRLVWLMLQRNARSQETWGNFQFDIKSPSDFKILSARKPKTLFQKYKLELTTGIHACIGYVLRKYIYREFLKDTTTADSRQNGSWKREFIFFSVSIVIIPTRLICQMHANSSGAEFLSTISNFMKRMTGSRAVDGKNVEILLIWLSRRRRILNFLLFTRHCDPSKTEYSRGKFNCSCW